MAARNSGVLDEVASPDFAVGESLNDSGEETIHAGPAFQMGREKMRNRILEGKFLNTTVLPKAWAEVVLC